ncbi:L-idonate 5-dehydrogenase [Photobacterium sp. DNB23_23_1]
MVDTYKALVLTDAKTTRVEQRKPRSLDSKEVRVRLGSAGICGTDLHYYQDFANAGFLLQNPLVLGHEASGTIVELGSDVNGLKVGEKVAITPVMNCGECENCRSGNSNTCTNKRFPGSATTIPHIDGFFREYFEVEARCCRKLPQSAELDKIAFVEPAACALHGVERAGDLIGRRVLVTGAGPIGTLAATMAKVSGAAEVVVSDLTDESLAIASQMGADKVINIRHTSVEDFIKENGEFDIAIEASGATSAYVSCLTGVKKQGTVVQLSVLAEKEPNLPANLIMLKELTLKGAFQFNGEFDRALALISLGRIDLTPMLSGQFKFEEASKAFDIAKDRSKSMKVQFVA